VNPFSKPTHYLESGDIDAALRFAAALAEDETLDLAS
jgi:hypothetical protein